MREAGANRSPLVGIIANPVSARDIRRVVANANSLQLADRVNIVLRAMAALGACGVTRVLMMPDREGLKPMLERHLARERAAASASHTWPQLEWLAMPTTASVDDTFQAARLMREAQVAAIVVLGGDGTHRAVVRECGQVPIAGLSTGTNNAYPELREATLAGLAVGLYATGRIAPDAALTFNKRLDVTLKAASGAVRDDIALVDVAIAREHYIGAKALWRTDSLAAVYLAFADPEAIGLSSIGGLLAPLGRYEPGGLHVQLSAAQPSEPGQCDERGAPTGHAPLFHLHAPIAPGLLQPVPVYGWQRLVDGEPVRVRERNGVVALDGEREITFGPTDHLSITLRERAFRSIAVAACLRYAALHGLLRGRPGLALATGVPPHGTAEAAGAAPAPPAPFPSPL
ncbi:NAD(+)/NADH kinase [Paraburkholderia sp. MMS20-SJTR3]|uniref:NAD(+)/NADH kinase n=1 Tax=Paraburkholderia sejongensis TaxID=2886946 RepID=A0ABS8JRC4_9BURK|nr:NAD(+)/NADH kinase [Paraburkholderia sp. MMS20-SJTR3]MCC8392418.1 NAD(+)/NADH kinase [Paraburkholderia sp. MMS20-SJTR3]